MGLSRWMPLGRSGAVLAVALAAMQAPVWAQQGRQAESRTQDAATQRQSAHTERANRDAAVADETSPAPHPGAANPVPSATPRPSAEPAPGLRYGPVLAPRGGQAQAPARKDPAEVRDETDTQARPAPADEAPRKQNKPVSHRRGALQPQGPLAPRPLRSADSAPFVPEPVPAPARAPQPIVPGTSAVNCGGGVCTTPSGGTVNLGVGNAGVGSSGRLCARTGANVQCF